MKAGSITLLFLVVGIWTSAKVFAQEATDLFLFQLHQSPDHRFHISNPKFLSGFNPGGYTNQPWFTASGDLLISVRRADGNQSDIYLLSPIAHSVRQLTRTRTNEYSPRITPDGKHLTVLRQIEGDSMDQQVCQVPLEGGAFKSLTPKIRDIGYYAWLNESDLGLFRIEGETNRLVYYNYRDDKSRRITSSIGRTLLSDGDGSIIYVHKFSSDYWYIKKYKPASSIIDIIIETPPESEDFAVAPDGTYFMGKDQKLFFFHPDRHTTWQEVGDLSIHGIKHITRLAVSADGRQLALVTTKDTP